MRLIYLITFLAMSAALLNAQNTTSEVYVEENGVLMVEIESADLTNPGNWVEETDTAGYTGTSYYVPRMSATEFTASKTNALAYSFKITEAGNYRLGLRNYYAHADVTEDNDVFAAVDDGAWIKTWSHRFEKGPHWNWETGMDTGGDNLLLPVFENLSAGEHTLYIDYRSPNFCLDRFYLVKVDDGRTAFGDGNWTSFDTASLHDVSYPVSLTESDTSSGDTTSDDTGSGDTEITGELKTWHRVTLTFDGPDLAESSSSTFLDYRLMVEFSHGADTFIVPGFFAADGNASETGAESGSKWRAHFTPNAEGVWNYTASFRTGSDIAIDLDPASGTPASFDGESGTFEIQASDKSGRDFRGKGMLEYVGEHYLRFAGTGEYFLKGGAGSPETFLAYSDFDGTYDAGGVDLPSLGENGLHEYEPHVDDWNTGDPLWQATKGKGIIGALNYLASTGANSVYFLSMNVQGDGQDVWPWTSHTARETFDCSKLDQWEIVFSHMDKLGIMMHIITQEIENDDLLDGGALGRHRKLYYRELVARFAHHPAVTWNLGEENENTEQQKKDFCDYIKALDPYDHHIVVHNWPNNEEGTFGGMLGYDNFDGIALQEHQDYYNEIRNWVTRSADAGHKWVCSIDEPLGWEYGCVPDAQDPDHDEARKDVMWGSYMAGGSGVEWYFGWQNNAPTSDLANEDWRNRHNMWIQTGNTLEFFNSNIPFHEMVSDESLVSNGWCLAKEGDIYLVYLRDGGSADLDLSGVSGDFTVEWFDCKNGGTLQDGSVTQVSGGGTVSTGTPPAGGDDWAAVVKSTDFVPVAGKNSGIEKSNKPQIRLNGSSLIIESNTAASMRADLLSLSGRKIKTLYNGDVKGSECLVSLDELNLSRGIYLLKIKTDRSINFERIIFSGK